MDTAEEKVISEESVAGGIFREILYLLLKIVAIATAIVVIFTIYLRGVPLCGQRHASGSERW